MRPILPLLCLLLLSACYRQDVRWVEIRTPDAGDTGELELLRARLLDMNRMMPADQSLYHEIEVIEEPAGLKIRYDARLQSIKNIEHEIARMGFQANDIPGQAAQREKLRQAPPRTADEDG